MTEQQAPKLVASFVEHQDAFIGLPSEDAQWAIQNTVEAIGLFVTAVKNRSEKVVEQVKEAIQAVKKTLTPFITIETGRTAAKKLIADIEVIPAEVSSYAKSMMANEAFTVSKEAGKVDLVSLSIAELGFVESPRTDQFMTAEFCAKWSAENLDGQAIELCQPEDGPQLRKQWNKQPKDMIVWMAMERISDSDGNPSVWFVGRDSRGRLWLDGRWAYADSRWSLHDRFVFRLRKI